MIYDLLHDTTVMTMVNIFLIVMIMMNIIIDDDNDKI